jgi:hypothetical protein
MVGYDCLVGDLLVTLDDVVLAKEARMGTLLRVSTYQLARNVLNPTWLKVEFDNM